MKSPSTFSRIFPLVLIALVGLPDWADARGFRGGGARGGGARVSRAHVNRPAPRPASRPATNKISRPVSTNRPSSLSHQAVNRTPAFSARTAAAGATAAAAAARTVAARPQNPKLQPLFDGAPAERKTAARQRMDTAMARNTSTVPRLQNTQLQATRVANRNNWGAAVRTRSAPNRRNVYNTAWINQRINRFPQRWFYWHRPHPYNWWWRTFAWASVGTWIVYDWGDPFYYDYGYNVYYEDQSVFVNDEPIASYDDYVQSAETLAENFADPPADEETEWESLGTWMLSTDPNAQDSRMMLQLVLGKNNLISGTYYNTQTDATQAIQGTVDPKTQRVAFTIGEKKTTILETGLANFTKENVPVWVHFTDDGTTQTWLMVRLEEPEDTGSAPPPAQ